MQALGFLLDGVGAFLTAVYMGLVLPHLSRWIGVPVSILYSLALLAMAYGVYSWGCYWLIKQTKPWMLVAVIVANLFYCFVAGIINLALAGITIWGRVYLIAEILIILGLVVIEGRVYQNAFRARRN